MFAILFLLFTALPVAELYFLFKAGSVFGAVNTIFLVVITGIIGAGILKQQGRMIFLKMRSELAQGVLPPNEILHSFLLFGGGVLLLTPGFITDICGILLILPGSRHLIALLLQKKLKKAIHQGNVKIFQSQSRIFSGGFYYQGPRQPPRYNSTETKTEREVIEAEVIQIDSTSRKP